MKHRVEQLLNMFLKYDRISDLRGMESPCYNVNPKNRKPKKIEKEKSKKRILYLVKSNPIKSNLYLKYKI